MASIAEMMAEHLAEQVPSLSCVVPADAGAGDAYPFVVYRTKRMRSVGPLNKRAQDWDFAVEWVVVTNDWDAASTLAEQIKDAFNDYTEAGEVYHVRECTIENETDVSTGQDDRGEECYAKTVETDGYATKVG